jgi:hypothetical protein
MKRFKANTDGLPDPLYRALTHDDYEQVGRYSISGLIGPPQPRVLMERHGTRLTHDPYDRLKSLLGTAMHHAIERHVDAETHLAEERFIATIDGVEISGQPDVFSLADGVLYDYKTTSTWVSEAGAKLEWEHQLNPYVWLLEQNGYQVSRCVIVAIYLDWSKTKLGFYKMRKQHYPEKPIELFEIPVWEAYVTEQFLADRVRAHEAANDLPDDALPECSAKERWQRDTWAVRKPGAVRASKVCDSEIEARQEAARLGSEYVVERRQGESLRCQHYCEAAPFCHQLRRMKA